jgi:serine protease
MPQTRFMLAVSCTALLSGALVLAEPQFQRQVPTVRVPNIRVPSIATPRVDVPTVPRGAMQSIAMPVMSAELMQAHLEASVRGLDYLPGRVLVKFKAGAGSADQARALSVLGGDRAVSDVERFGDLTIVKDSSGVDPRELAARLRQQPEIEYAQPDYLLELHSTPNDPSYAARQWNLSLLNMPRAWDIAQGGATDIIVAVVDTGITMLPPQLLEVKTWDGAAIVTHQLQVGHSPDFTPGRFVLSRDFTISTTAPPSNVIDTDGHGTHVGGTIGQDTNNGLALAGIAYNVRIMPLKACRGYWDIQFAMSAAGTPGRPPAGTTTGCPSSATSAAIRFAADNGARVLNYSIGGDSPNPVVLDAMRYAVSKGVFIAMSNGNDFEDGNPTKYPASYGPTIDGAMAVASVNRALGRSYYSSTGSWTEIAAPGGDSRQGNTIWQTSIRSSDASTALFFPRFDRYDERGFQGTSMASPHVAGLAALLMSRGHTDPALVEALIKETAQDLGSPGQDDSFGHGMIQPFRALFGRGVRR